MAALVELTHNSNFFSSASKKVGPPAAPEPVPVPSANTFVVKLRNTDTRSWGDQTEVVAASAREAAEQVAGEHLEGLGERANLRARVWKTPFGSVPDVQFYAAAPTPAE